MACRFIHALHRVVANTGFNIMDMGGGGEINVLESQHKARHIDEGSRKPGWKR